jgi:hypothetical protein
VRPAVRDERVDRLPADRLEIHFVGLPVDADVTLVNDLDEEFLVTDC